jgi:hypothetical protein
MPTTATPNLLRDPGYLFWAPLGTALPTNTVTGSVFTDAWDSAWINLGATREGSMFSIETTTEGIRVAELFYPVAYATTEKAGSIGFDLADWTLANLKRVNNGGTITVVSGTGATTLSSYEEADEGDEVRCMLGWESYDATTRIIVRQAFNGGTIESQNARAPEFASLNAVFNMEKPSAAKPYIVYTAGTARAGS